MIVWSVVLLFIRWVHYDQCDERNDDSFRKAEKQRINTKECLRNTVTSS